MPLLRLPERFDHRDWLFEIKHDGFRALAHVDGHRCALVSRNAHTFKHRPQLCEELAPAVKAHDAVIDGEIVCLDARGRSNFKSLLSRREWPYFYAFDLLAVDGEDLREWPVVERKRRLRRLIPSVPARLLYVDHVPARGRDFFEVACAHDLEGIVGKLASGRYHADGTSTNWNQESRVHANDGPPRTLRAPNTCPQTASDAARSISARLAMHGPQCGERASGCQNSGWLLMLRYVYRTGVLTSAELISTADGTSPTLIHPRYALYRYSTGKHNQCQRIHHRCPGAVSTWSHFWPLTCMSSMNGCSP